MQINTDTVKIIEVGPRDGLQFEKFNLSTAQKIQFINQLSATGLSYIEVSSFVNQDKIPSLADAEKVYRGIDKTPGILYSALVPNEEGMRRAMQSDIQSIAIFTAASETFCQKNINCSIEASLSRFEPIVALAKDNNIPIRAYISCIFACPYEGWIKTSEVMAIATRLSAMGCDEISLGDTIGIGTAAHTQQLLRAVTEYIPVEKIAVHFHDSRGQALANILTCLEQGVRCIDTSVAGLGGCPYAPGASGNVATEDVLYMLNGLGIKTGIDLPKLIRVGNDISQMLKRANQSKLARAGLPSWY